MWPPGRSRNAVAGGIGTRQDHSRAMGTKSFSLPTAGLIGFALLCGLQSTVGNPSFDPPMLYPEGLRRSADPALPDSDDSADSQPAAPAAQPALNPLLPLIKMKPGFMGPPLDPSQFIQMKADLLKNLLGPGGVKSSATRAVTPSKWSSAAWSSGSSAAAPSAPAAPASKWTSAKSKSKTAKAPSSAAATPSPWSWPPPPNAPAAPAPAAPAAPVQPAPAYWMPPAQAPAPAPAYYMPPPPAPAPGYWLPSSPNAFPAMDKKTALLEALLDQYLAPAPASRFARAPVTSASPTPSPYLSNLLDSLNLTLPSAPPTLQPTIEPPGFWFPSLIPAPPGSLYPFVVDPSAMVAKKGKFLSDLFASKAAASAALAASSVPTSAPSVAARAVEDEYSSKVAAYLNSILDPISSTKRAVPIPKKSSKAKPTAKPAKSAKPASPSAKPTNPPIVEEDEIPEDEADLDLLLGLRRKREIGDDSDADESSELDAATVAEKSAALLNDMAIVKQNILLQLDAMTKAQSAAAKASKLAAKAAKKASTIAGILNMPTPTPAVLPPTSLADFQHKIATLTNLYGILSDTQKNITSAPDASDPLNADKLFLAAVNTKVSKILMKNALLPTSAPAPKVARSHNSQKNYGQDSETSHQYESGKESNYRQKSAAPLVAAVFAPQTYHFNKEPNSWN